MTLHDKLSDYFYVNHHLVLTGDEINDIIDIFTKYAAQEFEKILTINPPE